MNKPLIFLFMVSISLGQNPNVPTKKVILVPILPAKDSRKKIYLQSNYESVLPAISDDDFKKFRDDMSQYDDNYVYAPVFVPKNDTKDK